MGLPEADSPGSKSYQTQPLGLPFTLINSSQSERMLQHLSGSPYHCRSSTSRAQLRISNLTRQASHTRPCFHAASTKLSPAPCSALRPKRSDPPPTSSHLYAPITHNAHQPPFTKPSLPHAPPTYFWRSAPSLSPMTQTHCIYTSEHGPARSTSHQHTMPPSRITSLDHPNFPHPAMPLSPDPLPRIPHTLKAP